MIITAKTTSSRLFAKMTRLLLLLAAAVALAIAAPERDGKLQVLSLSPAKLRVLYHTGPDEGLTVLSEANDEGNYITISTFSGVEIVSARFSSVGSAVLWKIMGHTIFLHNNTVSSVQSEMVEYVVPPEEVHATEKAMKRSHLPWKLRRTLGTDNVEETKRLALSELFACPEFAAILDLSRALGTAGVTGQSNAAALNLHGLAFNFAKLQGYYETAAENKPIESGSGSAAENKPIESGPGSAEEPVLSNDRKEQVFTPRRIQKRATCSRPGGWWGRGEITYTCERCPVRHDNCFGMCGKQCSCWSWVCGDCCFHQGCHDHDNCCRVHGFFHYICMLVFPFDCNRYRYQC